MEVVDLHLYASCGEEGRLHSRRSWVAKLKRGVCERRTSKTNDNWNDSVLLWELTTATYHVTSLVQTFSCSFLTLSSSFRGGIALSLARGYQWISWMCPWVSWRKANRKNMVFAFNIKCGRQTLSKLSCNLMRKSTSTYDCGPFSDTRKPWPDTTPGSIAALGAPRCTPCKAGTAPNLDRSECVRCADGQVQLIILSWAHVVGMVNPRSTNLTSFYNVSTLSSSSGKYNRLEWIMCSHRFLRVLYARARATVWSNIRCASWLAGAGLRIPQVHVSCMDVLWKSL